MSRTDDRVLTFIVIQDDFEPTYIAGAAAKAEAMYAAAAARHGITYRTVEAAELVPACVGGPRLWYRGEDLLAQRVEIAARLLLPELHPMKRTERAQHLAERHVHIKLAGLLRRLWLV